MKKTNEQKLYSKKITQPGFIYNALGWAWKTFVAKKYNVKYNFKFDFRKEKGPHILISNHASRADYIFTGVPLLPKRYNYVAGYNEFYRSHLSLVFGLLKVIPKKNFSPDGYAIKEISRILKNNGRIVIFPEGMNSISGANQPVAIGTGKLIKHFKLPVYYSVIKGGYLTSPKYNLKDRLGTIEVDFDRMFTPEDIEKLSAEEIEDIVNKSLYHDDYKWNKEKGYEYDIGDCGAENLENLLFICPKCKKEHVMVGEGNKFYCKECGNGFTLSKTYDMIPLSSDCVLPSTQTEWFNMQREIIKEQVKDENFSFSEKVKLGMLPKHDKLKNQATSLIVGEGTLTIDRTGLTYDGTKDGEPFTFHLSSNQVPTYGMCTDVSRFYTFYNGEFMEFYPEKNVVEKFFLATEEVHRINGGKWQDFKFEK